MFTHLHLKLVGMPLPKDLYKLLMKNITKVNIIAGIDAKITQFQLNKKILQTPKSAFENLTSSLEFLLLLSRTLILSHCHQAR
jgi:hypothetical protein